MTGIRSGPCPPRSEFDRVRIPARSRSSLRSTAEGRIARTSFAPVGGTSCPPDHVVPKDATAPDCSKDQNRIETAEPGQDAGRARAY